MLRIIKLLFLYLAYQLAFYAVSTGVYMIVENGSLDVTALNDSSTSMSVIIASQFLATLAIAIHVLAGKYVRISDLKLKSDKPFGLLLMSAVFILGMAMWTNYLSELAGLPDNMQQVFSEMMENPLGIISIVVMAPVVEELLFRGAIQGYLMRRYNRPYLGIVISSLIFGVIHANPAQIPFAVILGMALGWMYYVTGSLVPGIFMHFINNGSAVLLSCIYDSPDATMIMSFGNIGAACLAALGVVISVFSVVFIRKKLVQELPLWNDAQS